MDKRIAIIGFGEAGQTFANAGQWRDGARVFDIQTDRKQTAAAMRAAYERHGVLGADTLCEALRDAEVVLSLVTADQAMPVAMAAAKALPAGALFCDMNSVSPRRKRTSAEAIGAAGGRYVDVAVMAPVVPAALSAPLLVAGPYAPEGTAALCNLGFAAVQSVGERVGEASGTKMVRSILIKGIEALTAEMILAGAQGGNGVLVDAHCRTSLPNIFAIGDCALHGNRYADGAQIRLESVQNANDMASAVAKTRLGFSRAVAC